MKASEYKNLPDSPGVYLMKNKDGLTIYIGKAGNLRRRVSSYFLRSHDARITKMVSEIKTISVLQTDNVLEAFILESKLIKEKSPIYNIKDKDDKSFLYIEITKETFPRVLLVRGKSHIQGERFGPFTSSSSAREAMKILRRIFPWSVHSKSQVGAFRKPCFDYEIGLCPGVCAGHITRRDYMQNIKELKMFLSGKKKRLLLSLKKEMQISARKLDFERANLIKKRIFALLHIQDTALLGESDVVCDRRDKGARIEGYDVSNISGDYAVGAMVVFVNGEPDKNEYRRFKIKLFKSPNDAGMIREIITRRLKNNWLYPTLILVDGGKAQISAAKEALADKGLIIPVVGMIKGKDRKKTDLIGDISYVTSENKKILEKVRDEAHRFAIRYHREVRGANFKN